MDEETVVSAGSAGRLVARQVRGLPASDGAGVRLTRIIGTPYLDAVDPFLMLDEFRSDDPGDYIAGFPEHPHRGFETVTYMLAGRMRHGDNQGNSGVLEPGGLQWMTAGRGIVHSEMPEQQDGLMWGFQLWVNLPAARKMAAPRYQDVPPEAVPERTPAQGVQVRVLAGDAADARGPVEGIAVAPLMVDVALAAGASWTLPVPAGHAGFVYVFEGDVHVGPAARAAALPRGELAVLADGDTLTLTADGGGRCLVVAGRPIGEPVARHGPFVMNTREELQQAFEDYRVGRF
ncbi:pirin family protein [Arhodomonas sp. SL1]|uniref:pirin family protein n=1 Tax=Arhodomonas sp. SL1 TaxID=3425691 RepID=UPI003F882DC3